MRTRVTAILVAQRGGEWLDQTIAGLAEQTLAPDAIIAVNNGGPERVSKQLMAADVTRVVGISHRQSFGQAVAHGVKAAPAAPVAEAEPSARLESGAEPDPETAPSTPAEAGPEGGPEAEPESDTAAPDADAEAETDSESGSEPAAEPEGAVASVLADDPHLDAPDDWIWLLSEDSCPEPEALERIVSAVGRGPSVVVAGPKVVDWDHPERIIEMGESLTHYGGRWLLRRQELDQQQYDHMQDVMGVGPVGMLVRRDIWEQLGGFDPALRVYDDGLDFCVRARLAGYRVEVAPASRVRFAQSGVAGPRIDRARSVLRTAHRQARTAQLRRRISYAPAFVAFFMWLGLPLYGLGRVAWSLIREQPGYMIGEFVAALTVFFTPHTIISSRLRIRRQSTAGWDAIRPLRIDPKSVRTARMIDREIILASSRRQRRELHFISTGGLGVLVAAVVASAALTWWALPRTSLVGGGLAPLSSLDQLWWHTRTLDGVPADPFNWVLALLGTLTFWNPSHAIVLLMVVAIPLTALGGWIWGAQLTESKSGRALLGLGFALSPVLLGSLDGGRLPTLVLTVVLPWLLLAAARCRESWSWAGTASLLAGVALAAAPILLPAAVILLVVGFFSSLRGMVRVLTTAIVPLVLFAPKIVTSLLAGRPLDILRDPGVVSQFEPGTPWHLMLGFPEFGLEGWADVLNGIGLGGPPATLLIGVLMALLAFLALVGLFTGPVPVTLFSSLTGGLGMLTALASAQLHLAVSGNETIAVWTGSGLAVYWIALLSLAAVGADTLGRAAAPLVSLALVTALIAVVPVGSQLFLGQVPFRPASSQMPALVQAAGENDPGVRTIVVTPTAPHEVRAELVSGVGLRLDQIRSAALAPDETDADRTLAELVAGLASVGGDDVEKQLHAESIGFVLLPEGGDENERAELQRVFDQHSALTSAGLTDQGLLWRVVDPQADDDAAGDAAQRLGGTSISGETIWVIQLAVMLGMLLLALPTGEVTYRPARRKKPSKRKRRAAARQAAVRATAAGGSVGGAAVAVAESEAATEAADDAVSETVAEADTETVVVAESVVEAETEAEVDPEPGVEPEPDAASEPDPDPEPAPDSTAEPDSESKPDPEVANAHSDTDEPSEGGAR
ncbi:MAG: glycosyltransferase [Leucobacter sp.]